MVSPSKKTITVLLTFYTSLNHPVCESRTCWMLWERTSGILSTVLNPVPVSVQGSGSLHTTEKLPRTLSFEDV